jgi:MIT (microtubule interacting and transport) domain
VKPIANSDLEKAHFLIKEALDEDEDGNADEAIKLYSEAIELCIKARKQTEDRELASKLTKVNFLCFVIGATNVVDPTHKNYQSI